ncbi:MAG: aminotransferase class V-fold PLP-dependent enzyme, partial [Myxococcota bacterium]
FPGLRGEQVVQGLDLLGIAVSSGAACASGSIEPSPVLAALGDPEPAGGVRFSFGPDTTVDEVEAALAAVAELIPRIRAAAAWEAG